MNDNDNEVKKSLFLQMFTNICVMILTFGYFVLLFLFTIVVVILCIVPYILYKSILFIWNKIK